MGKEKQGKGKSQKTSSKTVKNEKGKRKTGKMEKGNRKKEHIQLVVSPSWMRRGTIFMDPILPAKLQTKIEHLAICQMS